MVNKVSLSGQKGCGKSAVALQVLNKYSGTDPVVLSFAQPLKCFLAEILSEVNEPDVVHEALYGDKDNTYVKTKGISRQDVEYAVMGLLNALKVDQTTNRFVSWAQESGVITESISGRELLQKVGTEFFRQKIKDTFWVDLMRQSILQNEGSTVVVDDTRFQDEFNLLKTLGFTMVNIVNPCEPSSRDTHLSENALGGVTFDYIFYNDKTLGKGNIDIFVENNL